MPEQQKKRMGMRFSFAFSFSGGAEGLRSRHGHHSNNNNNGNRGYYDGKSDLTISDSSSTEEKEPFFDPEIPGNLTVQLGGVAYLPCKVHNIGNNSVSGVTSCVICLIRCLLHFAFSL